MAPKDTWEALKGAAHETARSSYAPYSKLSIGAAVRTSSASIYRGANIENASYGLSICAERVAIADAVRDERPPDGGHANLLHAIVAVDSTGTIMSPCGACRQVILEFGAEAKVWLPAGPTSIQEALTAPFEPHASRSLVGTSLSRPTDTRVDRHLLTLFELDDSDKILLMRHIDGLRRRAADLYCKEIRLDHTRSILFVRVERGLAIAPGFFANLEDPAERTLCIPIRHGITGAAYALRRPNFGVPCHPGALPGDVLPDSEQRKVARDLKWVVTWPLGEFGAVSLDGYDTLDLHRMSDIAQSAELRKSVELMANLTEGM